MGVSEENELRALRVEVRGLRSQKDILKVLLHQAQGQIQLLQKRIKEAKHDQ